MKYLIYLIFFIAIIPLIYADGFDQAVVAGGAGGFLQPGICSGAIFCGESELECSYIADNICPENYGDWDGCRLNNYEKRCTRCDPDCGDCGQRVSIDVPDSVANSQINIYTNAFGYTFDEETEYYLAVLYNGSNGAILRPPIRIYSCENDICSVSFMKTSPNDYCKTYQYGVRYYVREEGNIRELSNTTLWDDGRTAPYISVSDIDENSNFNINANCDRGDEMVDGDENDEGLIIYLYLEKLIDNEFVHINSNGDVCNIPLTPQGGGCPLGTLQETRTNNFVYNFDNTNFDNGHYRINAFVKPYILEWQVPEIMYNYPPGYDSSEFDIDKGLIGETGGTYQGSKILNIVLAKIKTWI